MDQLEGPWRTVAGPFASPNNADVHVKCVPLLNATVVDLDFAYGLRTAYHTVVPAANLIPR